MNLKPSFHILRKWLEEKYRQVQLNRILDKEEEFEKYLDVTSQGLLDFTSSYMKKNVYDIIERCERRGKLDATSLKSEVRALYDSLSSNQKDIPNKFTK